MYYFFMSVVHKDIWWYILNKFILSRSSQVSCKLACNLFNSCLPSGPYELKKCPGVKCQCLLNCHIMANCLINDEYNLYKYFQKYYKVSKFKEIHQLFIWVSRCGSVSANEFLSKEYPKIFINPKIVSSIVYECIMTDNVDLFKFLEKHGLSTTRRYMSGKSTKLIQLHKYLCDKGQKTNLCIIRINGIHYGLSPDLWQT